MRKYYKPKPGVPKPVSLYMAALGRMASKTKKRAAARARWDLAKKAKDLRALPIPVQRKIMESQCNPAIVKHYEVTCPECGNYYPGHATGGQDICTCETNSEPSQH